MKSEAVLHGVAQPQADGRAPDRSRAVRDAIQAAIVDHRLPPGTKLSEDEVGDAFGVSRTVVRAALQGLSFSGLVVLERNRGAFVASPGAEEARQVFAARRLVEAELATAAAGRFTAADAAHLRTHIDREEHALTARDRRTAIRLSGDLHLQVATLSGNDILARFLDELVARSSLIIALYGASGTSACGVREHRSIIDALESGDGDRAAALMIAHLDHIADDLDLTQAAPAEQSLASLLKP